MSIDAIINKVTENGNNLVLDLMPREVSGNVGQDEMIIINYTHIPSVGQEIWGGSGGCIIEPSCGVEDQKHYLRIGYTRLEEYFH